MTIENPLPLPSSKAFSYPGYRLFWFTIMANTFASQILSVAVAWQVYDQTRNPLYLGLIGLVQFLPALMLVLVTGLAADRFSRRIIMSVCLAVQIACVSTILWLTVSGNTNVWLVLGVLAIMGVSRAFLGPAENSLAPNLVPPVALPNAVATTASAWQLSNIVGPMVGGLLYGLGAAVAFGTAAGMVVVGFFLVLFIPRPAQSREPQAKALKQILAGFHYVWHQKVVLGAISLDLFAVLMGGAVALLPVYARDILETGPWGLGLLRAAPGVGAILMALALHRFPVRDHAGKVLLICVSLFGASTILFGFSTSVWIAVPALFLVGATDMISVVIRETLMQLWTPDELRGRVNAVNMVFIGASNELGEFRAGVMAFWVGAVAAVTIGGAATIGVAATWSVLFPQLREARKLDKVAV